MQGPSPFLARVFYAECFRIHLSAASRDEEHVRCSTCLLLWCLVVGFTRFVRRLGRVSVQAKDGRSSFVSMERFFGLAVEPSFVYVRLLVRIRRTRATKHVDTWFRSAPTTSSKRQTDAMGKRIPKSPTPSPLWFCLSPSDPAKKEEKDPTKVGRQDPRDERCRFSDGMDRDHGASHRDLCARDRDVGRTVGNSLKNRHLHRSIPTTDGHAKAEKEPWIDEEVESRLPISKQGSSIASTCASLGETSHGRRKGKGVQPSPM